MGRILRYLMLSVLAGLPCAAPARAQLPLVPSLKVGAAIPLRSEADRFGTGVHVGAALRLPMLPLQLEGAYDRMGAKDTGEGLSVWSVAAAVPISLTPSLLPVGIYAIGSGGLYRHDAGTPATDLGLTAGAGARLRLPGLQPFAEARGVLVLAEGNRLTYLTAAVGLRF